MSATSTIELISVIVPTRGRSPKLMNLLDALEHQAGETRARFEVIVVVDGTGDAPDGAFSIPIACIETEHLGAGPARNLGIERATGDAVLFLNDDVIPDSGFIDAHVDMLNAGNQAVLGDSPWIEPKDGSASAFDGLMARTPAVFDLQSLVHGQLYDFKYGWTLNLSLRREVIDALDHPFDPLLRPIYFEDIEFVYRCFGSDLALRFCTDARAVHDHRVTLGEYFAREVLLGMMSVVFHQANPRCAETIFPVLPQAHARAVAQMLELDVRDHQKILDRVIACSAEPLHERESDEQAMMLYDLHLPIKRRAFRIGLCAMCRHEIPWDQRVERARYLFESDPVFERLS